MSDLFLELSVVHWAFIIGLLILFFFLLVFLGGWYYRKNRVRQIIQNDLEDFKKDLTEKKRETEYPSQKDDSKQPKISPFLEGNCFLPRKQYLKQDFAFDHSQWKYYDAIPLGELNKGDIVKIDCSEEYGKKFSCYLIDKRDIIHFISVKRLKKSSESLKAIYRKEDIIESKIFCSIKHRNDYFVLFTHPGDSHNRLIKYRIEIKSKD